MQATQFALLSRCKFCGNCQRCNFNLSTAEETFLNEAIKLYILERIQFWLKNNKPILQTGHHGAEDPSKTLVTATLRNTKKRCPLTKTTVTYADQACYAWTPHIPQTPECTQ